MSMNAGMQATVDMEAPGVEETVEEDILAELRNISSDVKHVRTFCGEIRAAIVFLLVAPAVIALVWFVIKGLRYLFFDHPP